MSDISTIAVAAVTVLVGTYLKDFVAEDFRRFRDAQALAGALAGELQSHAAAIDFVRSPLERALALCQGAQPLTFYEIEKPASPIYEANVARIGILGPDLARRLAATYEQINGFRTGFVMLCKNHKDMHSGVQEALILGCLNSLKRAEYAGAGLIEALNEKANTDYRQKIRSSLSSLYRLITSLG